MKLKVNFNKNKKTILKFKIQKKKFSKKNKIQKKKSREKIINNYNLQNKMKKFKI